MFDNLSSKLDQAFQVLKGHGKITEIKNYYDQNREILSQKITLEDLNFTKPKYKKKRKKILQKDILIIIF